MRGYFIKRLSHQPKNNLIGVNGVTFYKNYDNSSNSEEKVYDEIYYSKRTLNLYHFNKLVNSEILISPINKREISVKDLIKVSDKENNGDINCRISSKLSGFSFEEKVGEVIEIILSVLTKYKNQNRTSTWNFFSKKVNEGGKDSVRIYISLPKNRNELRELVLAFAEIAEVVKVISGYRCFVNIIVPRNSSPKFRQKEYSTILFGTLGVYLGSRLLNSVSEKMLTLLTKKNEYSRDVETKLINWAKKQGDLLLVNLGNSSFYITREFYNKNPKEKQKLMEVGNIDDPRTVTDYLAKAISEDKDLVVYSDINSTVVLAHEIGHSIVSKKKFLKRLQNNTFWRAISRSDAFIGFIGLLLGITGNVLAGVLSTIMMKCPVLITEFAASYYGFRLLKKLGCSKEDLRKAKSDFRKAYITYINGALGISLSALFGGAVGEVYEIPENLNLPDII